MIKAIIFDMDGVFFDSHDAWFKVFNKSRENFGFKPISLEEFDKNCWSVDSSIVVPRYFPKKSIQEVTSYYDKIFFEFMGDIKITPDVKETLTKLKEKGLKLAVATNTYNRQANRILKEIGIAHFFDIIVGADDVRAGKPEPDMILKVVKDLRLNIKEVKFIGDSQIDIDTCKNAKCSTIGFKIDGDERIGDFKELLNLVV